MVYSDFNLETVCDVFGLTPVTETIFSDVVPIKPSAWLVETLDKGREVALISEKVRSELMVMPILLESREACGGRFVIFSGQRLDVAPELGLTGECDFVLSLSRPSPVLRAPAVVVLEAKKGDIEAALGQAIAQMVGTRRFNDRAGRPNLTIFGCVTTGEDWQFLRLMASRVSFEQSRYYLANLDGILGVFAAMIASYPPEAMAA